MIWKNLAGCGEERRKVALVSQLVTATCLETTGFGAMLGYSVPGMPLTVPVCVLFSSLNFPNTQ